MTERYSSVAKGLHWAIALLIIGQIAGGWLMTHLALTTDTEFLTYQLHKSFGFCVLGLSIVRLIWRLTHRAPALPSGMASWEKTVARLTHWVFYGLMIGVPILGWALVSVDPLQIPTKVFFLIPVPHLPLPVAASLAERFAELHQYAARATLALVVLHVAAALKHHFHDRDNVLRSMLAQGRIGQVAPFAGIGVIALAAVASIALIGLRGGDHGGHDRESIAAGNPATITVQDQAPLAAGLWAVDAQASTLTMTGLAFGQPYSVRIGEFDARITLDVDANSASLPVGTALPGGIEVEMDMASLAGVGPDIIDRLQGAQWFNAATFPVAHFISEQVSVTETGFRAVGSLTILEVTDAVEVDFALAFDGPRAVATPQGLTIGRSTFALGQGASGVDEEVTIDFRIEADRTQ